MKTTHILGTTLTLVFFLFPAWAQSLGTSNLVESPTAGGSSVMLITKDSWTATANDTWLHLSGANQGGVGSADVIFTRDANPGATRTGTLTIAGQTLTVTQAGSTCAAIANTAALVSSGGVIPEVWRVVRLPG